MVKLVKKKKKMKRVKNESDITRGQELAYFVESNECGFIEHNVNVL